MHLKIKQYYFILSITLQCLLLEVFINAWK